MKTYEQTIAVLGRHSFHLYMSGELYPEPDGIQIVSIIYNVPEVTVRADVSAYRLELLRQHRYERYEA